MREGIVAVKEQYLLQLTGNREPNIQAEYNLNSYIRL